MEEEAAVRQTTPKMRPLLSPVLMVAPHTEILSPNSTGTEHQWCVERRSPFLATGRRRWWRCPDLSLGRDHWLRIRLLAPSEGAELLALILTSTEEEEPLLLLTRLVKVLFEE